MNEFNHIVDTTPPREINYLSFFDDNEWLAAVLPPIDEDFPRIAHAGWIDPETAAAPPRIRDVELGGLVSPAAERDRLIDGVEPLRPCPFCGGRALCHLNVATRNYVVICGGCDSKGTHGEPTASRAAWNRRAADAQIAALEAWIEEAGTAIVELRVALTDRLNEALTLRSMVRETPQTIHLVAQRNERVANWRDALMLLQSKLGGIDDTKN